MARPVHNFTPASNCILPENTAVAGVAFLHKIHSFDITVSMTREVIRGLGLVCVV